MAILALLFLVVPLVELFVIIQVGQAIGALNTVGILLLDSLIGGWLMKREGLGVMRRLQAQVQNGKVPGKEIGDAFLILYGGALMLTPGFLSDILGMALLLPPVRAVVRPALMKRVTTMTMNRSGFRGPGGGGFIDV